MTDTKELPDLIASQLAHYAPNLTTPEISAMAAAIVGVNAYRAQDGKLVPTSREAIRQITNFAPSAFLTGVSRAAAESAANPMMKTIAYLNGIGAESMEAAGGMTLGMPAALADAVQRDIASMPTPRRLPPPDSE